jgi:hypothetical protein
MTEMDLSERLIQAAAETRNIGHSNLMLDARRRIGRVEEVPAYCKQFLIARPNNEYSRGFTAGGQFVLDELESVLKLGAPNERPQKSTKPH